jgi:hypothetical protein
MCAACDGAHRLPARMGVRRSAPNYFFELETLINSGIFLIPARQVCITSFITLPN